MGKEKQIEEMAKTIKTSLDDLGVGTFNFTGSEFSTMLANDLYNTGYRKQSEGEWIFHKDGSATCNQCNTTQKHIWDMDNYQSYCGHCGAKMKGGEE